MRKINLRPYMSYTVPWLVWRPEYGESEDDARLVMAPSAEAAAADFGEHDDSHSADYTIVGGTDVLMCVRRATDDGAPVGELVERFMVSGETVPQYRARKAPEKPRGETADERSERRASGGGSQ